MQPRVAEELAFTYSMLRRYDDGIALLDLVIEMEPENHSAKVGKGYQVIRRDGTADTLAAMLQRIPADWDEGGQGVWARVGLALLQRRPKQALDVLNATPSDWSFGKGPIARYRLELRAQVYAQMGDTVRARADYETARAALQDSVTANPTDPWWRALLGLAYAGLQQRSDAVREARLATELLPVSKDAIGGPRVMATAAEILARVGDTDGALELLDRLLGMNAGVVASVPLMRLDPAWDPLRKDPRFERLLQR